MGIDIPESRREENALRDHEEQKARHEHTIEEQERHPEDGKAYHEMKEAKEAVDGDLWFEHKGERRVQDVTDSELKEEINTDFRQGESV